jgi:peptidyl-prolyl cis-trans isomerase C
MNLHRTVSTMALVALLASAGLAVAAAEATKETKPAAAKAVPPATETKAAETKADPKTPVARIGAAVITRGELDRAVKVLSSQNRLPVGTTPEAKKQTESTALDQLVAAELLYQAGLKNPPADLDKQVEAKMSQGKSRFAKPEEYEAALKSADLSEKELVEITRKDVVITSFVEREIAGKIKVSDDEIKKFYNDNKDRFSQEAQVRASHILCGVDAKATDEEKKKAREKAAGLLKEIKAGKDFAELAKSNSTCPSSAQGGDLGYFGKGQMVAPFEKAALGLKPGEVSEVVETQFGYHIIKLTDKKEAQTVKLEEVKEKIESYLKGQMVQKAVMEFVTEQRTKAKVEKML